MGFVARLLLIGVVTGLALPVNAQDLSPRAYVITPTGFNAITMTWSYFNGGLNLNGTIPVTGATGTFNIVSFTYYHSFNLFGRSANIAVSLPYGIGTFQGMLQQQQVSVYRSGLVDFGARFSVNLIGGPAMPIEKFARWKQKVLLGASLKIVAPTGQYDPVKLVNWGINRWAFKPELGYSQHWGNWLLDAYAGVVLHHQLGILRCSVSQTTNRRTRWRFGRSFEPQLQDWDVGLVGWQLLVGRRHESERHTESRHQTDWLAYRGYGCVAVFQAPVTEGQLQRRHIYSVRW